MNRYIVHNISRAGCIPHIPLSIENDRGCVLDTMNQERHLLTGKLQPRTVFVGYMPSCIAQAAKLNAGTK